MGFLTRFAPGAAALVLVAAVAGCVSRPQVAATVAQTGGLTATTIATRQFDLYGAIRQSGNGAALTIYIEGDGYAWVTPGRPSSDPTPKDPMALRLAAADPAAKVAWLARPCQYAGGVSARNCAEIFWTEGRFAEEVVAASSQAVDRLKQATGAQRIRLVGYSGGGAVAALLAARRNDVDLLVTVAAMLDGDAWTRGEGLTPLWRSLDPGQAVAALAMTRQIHFIGGADRDIPPQVAASFARRFGPGHAPAVVTLDGFDHRCCWAEDWPRLLARAEREARLP